MFLKNKKTKTYVVLSNPTVSTKTDVSAEDAFSIVYFIELCFGWIENWEMH